MAYREQLQKACFILHDRVYSLLLKQILIGQNVSILDDLPQAGVYSYDHLSYLGRVKTRRRFLNHLVKPRTALCPLQLVRLCLASVIIDELGCFPSYSYFFACR